MARGSSATGRSSEFFSITWDPSPFDWTQPEQPDMCAGIAENSSADTRVNPESRTDSAGV
jgi:hypothetical protein